MASMSDRVRRARRGAKALPAVTAGLASLSLAAAPAGAQDAPTALSGVTVSASKRQDLPGVTVSPAAVCLGPRSAHPDPTIPKPRVVESFPAQGAVVRPGLLVLRLTFNVAMSCDGLFQAAAPLEKPCRADRRQHVVLSFDRRTLRMACVVEPGRAYGLRLNPGGLLGGLRGKAPFKSLAGWPAAPFELTFSTSSGAPAASLEEAEAEDAWTSNTLLAQAAADQIPPAPAGDAPAKTEVSGVTVAPPPRCLAARRVPDPDVPHPKVVSSFPASGDVVQPGVVMIRVTFDLPMSCNGMFQAVAGLSDPCPGRTQTLFMSADRRTIATECRAEPGVQYGVSVNGTLEHAFTGLSGWTSASYELHFRTGSGPPAASVEEALAEDPGGDGLGLIAAR